MFSRNQLLKSFVKLLLALTKLDPTAFSLQPQPSTSKAIPDSSATIIQGYNQVTSGSTEAQGKLTKSQRKNLAKKQCRQRENAIAKSLGTISLKQEHHLERQAKITLRRACRSHSKGVKKAVETRNIEEKIDNLKKHLSSSVTAKQAKNNIPSRQESRELLFKAAKLGALADKFIRTKQVLDSDEKAPQGILSDGLDLVHKKLYH